MIPDQKRIVGKGLSRSAKDQGWMRSIGTHKLPNKVSLIEIEADSKAGHAVEPRNEIHASLDCAATNEGVIAASVTTPNLRTDRFPWRDGAVRPADADVGNDMLSVGACADDTSANKSWLER